MATRLPPYSGRLFAMVSDQGTAMAETVLTDEEYANPDIRGAFEDDPPEDAKLPIEWHDVTDNETCQFYWEFGDEGGT